MLQFLLHTILFLECLQSGNSFVGISTRNHQTWVLLQEKYTTPTALSAARITLPSPRHFPSMAVALPPPVSIDVGPLQYSWYEDVGNAGFQRKIAYRDDDDDELFELAYASFGYDGKVKRSPQLYDEEDSKPKRSRLRRGIAWVTRRLRGRRQHS